LGRTGGTGAARAARIGTRSPLRAGVRNVSGAELASAKLDGQPLEATSEARMESIRDLFRKGQQKQDKVKVAVNTDGSIEVIDGRHRILVAQEPEFRNHKIRVEFSKGVGKRVRKAK
jgi:hypothetical protein